MRVIVPFGTSDPKSRLSSVLDADERREFAEAMLGDVLDALDGHDPEVLADASVDCDAPVTVDERPLTDAIDAVIAAGTPVAVVMADLALVTPDAVERLFAPDADVVFAPGLGGGTNAMVVRHPGFRTDYHGASIRDHRNAARSLDASVAEVDSFRLAADVDEPSDLAEVILHSDGRAADWLADTGVELRLCDGRTTVERSDSDS